MKKIKKTVCIIAAAMAALCAVFALTACGGDDNGIVELRVENAKISFMRGEMFETGENFAVYAQYKDGTSENITDKVTVRRESGMDMNVAGDYQITVVYGEKRVIYTVYVNDREDVVKKIDVDTSAVKTQYRLGEEFTTDGLVLDLIYENAHGVSFPVTTTSLDGFNVTVANANGVVIDDVFTALGSFTVTVARGNVTATYAVTVDGVDISSVQSALTVAMCFRSDIASGSINVKGARNVYGEESGLRPGEAFISSVWEYSFGENYSLLRETHEDPRSEYHCGVDEKGFFVVYLQGGAIKVSNRNNSAMIEGAPISLWYSDEIEYGIENALVNLFEHGLQCSNNDLQQTVDEDEKSFSFAFSGLVQRENTSDYYETTATFKLGDDNAIVQASITQDYYENNSGLAEQEGYVPTFTTDPVTGKTTPGDKYSHRTMITVDQATGQRTAQNPYSRDMFNISSYTLSYNDKALEDGAVIECRAGKIYKLQIKDVLPSTASVEVDGMLFNYEGSTLKDDHWLSNEHLAVVRTGSNIEISTKHGGTWTLILKTAKTSRTLVLKVTGEPPSDMQPKLYNNVSGAFYDGNEKTVSIGTTAYFYGAVDKYTDPAQTATVESDNAEFATVESATVKGVDCWKFTATQAGTYQISIVSDSSPLVRCIVMITVSDVADMGAVLSGTYTAQDRVGKIYSVTFTQTGDDPLSGSVLVVCTPTDDDNTPITSEAVRQTLDFVVDGGEIVIAHDPADLLWVEFKLNENNELVLVDSHETDYVLSREE